MSLDKVQVVDRPAGKATVRIFRGPDSLLVVFEEKDGSEDPVFYPPPPWKNTSFLQGGLRVTLAAQGLSQAEWKALTAQIK